MILRGFGVGSGQGLELALDILVAVSSESVTGSVMFSESVRGLVVLLEST
jgi:hypothetical protein